ncbi:MAG: DUF6152 family protein [Bryobacteraceae bacterium]
MRRGVEFAILRAATRLTIIFVITLLAMSLAPEPVQAHHGAAQFDPNKNVTLKGTITVFQFTNPHAMIQFDVRDAAGQTVHWIGELQAPNILRRGGWNKNTLKPGDAVTLHGYPMKDGTPAVWINRLIGPDGQDLPLFNH